jgi:succinate-semialdehyde dehydrogenase
MPKALYEKAIEIFKKNGCLYIDKPEDVAKLRTTLFPGGVMDKNVVGQSAKKIAEMCGFAYGDDLKVILVKADAYGKEDLLSKEKMCPVIATYDFLENWDDCIKCAHANLEVEGKGHTVCIHTNTPEHAEAASAVLPVSRFLINQICSTSNGGSFFNSLSATTTLGCGSWGNNSISENLSWKHLFNVSRIAYVRPGATAPTDEEIWG